MWMKCKCLNVQTHLQGLFHLSDGLSEKVQNSWQDSLLDAAVSYQKDIQNADVRGSYTSRRVRILKQPIDVAFEAYNPINIV